MRVVVTGSRGWTDEGAIYVRVASLPPGTTIVVGDARGADQIAAEAAFLHDLHVERWPAWWDKYGKRAGLYRNVEMVKSGPDLVLAFWDGKSRGTAHCISVARARGIPVEVISPSQVGASPRR